MLNKINEITKLLSYSYNYDTSNIINNILDTTIEKCESLYYKTVLYPQLENIWNNESNNCDDSIDSINYYHLEKLNISNSSNYNRDIDSASDIDESQIQSNMSISQLSYKTINKDTNRNYILKDITVLIYIYVATQPISVFSIYQ
jgi:hypothetical protein